ncbi:Apoptosis-inducing factor 1 [Penicillium maclennaniae]|uniref:Apoptosis-inducing factor 1 n=1 Tax=Penicillium maclennaniae TaxID=1343394 RepID=UPI0025401DB9|nr:Apoptosis-inducing factor 1 [Penicillium maclennaniae]KAJ5681474.1 Apoptosis-inducing factor 1 [Penicillium maclennaniae]
MSQEFKLKDFTSLSSLAPQRQDRVHALTPKCSHYGAPLKNGVVGANGRLTCPWHGGPEKNGAVYILGTENDIKSGHRNPVGKCSVSSEEKVVIIGGGSGTISTLQTLRALKFSGNITSISKESIPIDRPKLSKALIPDASKITLRPEQWFADAGITTLVDEVTSINLESKSVSTKSGKSIPYTKLVLATGGIPRRLPLPGFDLGNVFTLRSVDNVQEILSALEKKEKPKVVVIGSSFIGMEVGNALRGKEYDVTVVGMENVPMERIMGAQVGKIFQENLEKNGVVFKLGASVDKATASEGGKDVGAVHLKDGTVLPADVVILGVGVRPATDYLKGSGIALEEDGSVATDEYFLLRGHDDIFAIGDIATYPYNGPGGEGKPVRIEHWNVAQNAGRSVGRAIAHAQRNDVRSVGVKDFIPVFWSAVGGQMRYCGNTGNGFDDVVLVQPESGKFTAYYTKGETVVAVATMGMDPIMVKCAELMREGKMVGKKEVQSGVDVLKI